MFYKIEIDDDFHKNSEYTQDKYLSLELAKAKVNWILETWCNHNDRIYIVCYKPTFGLQSTPIGHICYHNGKIMLSGVVEYGIYPDYLISPLL